MITINGERWRINLVSPSHPYLMTPRGRRAWGVCDDITKGIYITNTLHPKQLKKVLCHELVHASMYSYDVNISDAEEELVADLIATYGAEIISNTNKAFNEIYPK